jgi:hypothetical protein
VWLPQQEHVGRACHTLLEGGRASLLVREEERERSELELVHDKASYSRAE